MRRFICGPVPPVPLPACDARPRRPSRLAPSRGARRTPSPAPGPVPPSRAPGKLPRVAAAPESRPGPVPNPRPRSAPCGPESSPRSAPASPEPSPAPRPSSAAPELPLLGWSPALAVSVAAPEVAPCAENPAPAEPATPGTTFPGRGPGAEPVPPGMNPGLVPAPLESRPPPNGGSIGGVSRFPGPPEPRSSRASCGRGAGASPPPPGQSLAATPPGQLAASPVVSAPVRKCQ